MRYLDRREAGRKLADALSDFANSASVVLALPRGGVVLGREVADQLNIPLGLIIVKKIGHPKDPEYAIGAVAENGEPVYESKEISNIDERWLQQEVQKARQIVNKRRQQYYKNGYEQPVIKNKTVILVDDGIATGLTMRAAVLAVKKRDPKRVIIATPVASVESVSELREVTNKLIVLESPEYFSGSVGAHYKFFEQVDDEEVIELLQEGIDVTTKNPTKTL